MIVDLVWYFDKAEWVFPLYRDGVRAAMEVLERMGHKVRWHLGVNPQIPADSDFILVWDNSTSPFLDKLRGYPQRKGLILTTDLGLNIDALRAYDVIFAEAQPVVDKIRPHGIRVIKAFGTDDKFFSPKDTKKLYKFIYPATFSPWKRQDLFAQAVGKDGLCVGTIQPDGWALYKRCVEAGTQTIIGYMPVELLKQLYDMSENVVITGWEGSGRTVLEALSMDLPVKVAEDNHKCRSYIEEFEASGLPPREFIKKFYSAEVYAQNLLKGILDD